MSYWGLCERMAAVRFCELRRVPLYSVGYSNHTHFKKDMDVIERLWRQDIDMGICRDDSLSTKEGYELEKPLKKPEDNAWDNFSIDNETGEFMQPIIDPTNQVNTQQITTIPQQPQLQFPCQTQESGMTLEECLQILEEDISYPLQGPRQEPEPAMHHQMHTPQELEQRWQDFASLSDINLTLPAINPEVSPEFNPEFHQQSVMPENFAINSSINFGMNFPNTTENLNMLHYPSSHQTTNVTVGMHSSDDVFSSTPSLSDLSVNTTSLPSASLHIPGTGMNFTNLLISETNRSITDEYGGQNDTSSSSSRNSTSPLLLDLLNSSSLDEVDTMDIDGQIRDVMDVLDDGDSAISLGSVSQYTEQSDSSSLYSGSDESSEGAVGYDGSLDQDVKGASGYSRGNTQYGGDRQGQTNNGKQQSSMNNIAHNHTYSDLSSRNGSVNGTNSKKNQQQKNEEMGSRYSRDEKRAKMLKIPIPIEKIIELPVDQFNELLKKFELNDAQLSLIRDIRRRGKNKVAAQNCRKRKIDAIYTIEEEIDLLKAEKDQLLKERGNIDKESQEMRDRYTHLYHEVFQSLRDDHGDPVNPNNFSLQQMPDGTVYLVPRNSTSQDEEEKDK
ncbi:endoplasmic reticulum membrane sensor NFE2L1-like isoform X2 [Anneissia japonica]|uniref:endoplasmic reticulum membrane sensor NFE2L1-like isoform X2 n=1 Tax=Anneissia japonica TaxID=1529436 RepID=UPI0014258F54|nr:endoplasmic reticulum membrane sensor NFE2L1-like isoform X2 [Anneissia japonica]